VHSGAQGDSHSGISGAHTDPLSIGRGDGGEVALAQPRNVRRSRDDRSSGREQAQRPELGMVVVEVRQEHGVSAVPVSRHGTASPPPQGPRMAAQERIRDEPDTVDIEDDCGVTQPRHGGVHAGFSRPSPGTV
jgi:hypothetical protein